MPGLWIVEKQRGKNGQDSGNVTLMCKITMFYKANAGVGCDGFHPEVTLDLATETGGILGEGGTKREVAAASLHYNVLLDPEQCYE